jgi:class 3 adenylate cyclase
MDYTAQGHTVGLAQRMEALAEAGKIYLTTATAQRIKGYFALEDLGAFNVKGASAPVHAYTLEGARPLAHALRRLACPWPLALRRP